jgi:hypothetical protein
MAKKSLEKKVIENEKKMQKEAEAGKLPCSLLKKGIGGVFAYFCILLVIFSAVILLVSALWKPINLGSTIFEAGIFALILTGLHYLMINRKE